MTLKGPIRAGLQVLSQGEVLLAATRKLTKAGLQVHDRTRATPLTEAVHILNGAVNLAGVQTLNGALNAAMQTLLGATCPSGAILTEARGPTEAMLHTGVILIEARGQTEAMFPTGVTLVKVEGPKEAGLHRGVAGHPALDLNGHITVEEAISYRGVLHLMIAQ